MYLKTAHGVCCGSAHITSGIPCQDAATGWVTEKGAAIILSDGAGSCCYAAEGAATVVSEVSKLLRNCCDILSESEFEPEKVIQLCVEALSRNPFDLHDQACTLLFCVANTNGEFVLGHIGDGYAFLDRAGQSQLLSDAENGVFVNETFFVTSPNAKQHLRIQRGQLGLNDSIVICSDGAGTALYDRQNETCAPAIAAIAKWLSRQPQELVSEALVLNMETLMRAHSSDDMSIAVISRISEEE